SPFSSLIISPRPQSRRVQRYRDYHIEVVAKSSRRQVGSVNEPQPESDLRSIPVFQCVQQPLHLTLLPKSQKSCRCNNGNPPAHARCQGIVWIQMHIRTGKITEALCAENAFTFYQRTLASFAVVWVEQ